MNDATIEARIAAFVVLRSITHAVAYSINLDREMCFGAIEIEHVWTDWVLAAEDRLSWKACT